MKPKQSDKMRDQEKPEVFGFELHRDTLTPVRGVINVTKPGDYGCDPLGEIDGSFKWRMVPSGDVVGESEMKRRLGR